MYYTIQQKLKEIEQSKNVKILYAAESGSRAWGFASPDSDYDVRFIYVCRPEDYLKIIRPRDVIEGQLDEVFDINGWDIQKALRLLNKSNPTLFEWASSPVVYCDTPQWKALKPLIDRYFSSKSGMYHYLSMAVKNYREYLKGDMVKIKKYLYVLRPILACKWILDHHTPPPMLFSDLVNAELEPDIKPHIDTILEIKKNVSEKELMPQMKAVNLYIERMIETLNESIKSMPSEKPQGMEPLETVFAHILEEIWHI